MSHVPVIPHVQSRSTAHIPSSRFPVGWLLHTHCHIQGIFSPKITMTLRWVEDDPNMDFYIVYTVRLDTIVTI